MSPPDPGQLRAAAAPELWQQWNKLSLNDGGDPRAHGNAPVPGSSVLPGPSAGPTHAAGVQRNEPDGPRESHGQVAGRALLKMLQSSAPPPAPQAPPLVPPPQSALHARDANATAFSDRSFAPTPATGALQQAEQGWGGYGQVASLWPDQGAPGGALGQSIWSSGIKAPGPALGAPATPLNHAPIPGAASFWGRHGVLWPRAEAWAPARQCRQERRDEDSFNLASLYVSVPSAKQSPSQSLCASKHLTSPPGASNAGHPGIPGQQPPFQHQAMAAMPHWDPQPPPPPPSAPGPPAYPHQHYPQLQHRQAPATAGCAEPFQQQHQPQQQVSFQQQQMQLLQALQQARAAGGVAPPPPPAHQVRTRSPLRILHRMPTGRGIADLVVGLRCRSLRCGRSCTMGKNP